MIASDSEFLQLAMNHYDNPQLSSLEEFTSDLRRFQSLNILCDRYNSDKSELKERLIINHLVILSNCFTVPCLLDMLRYKIKPENTRTINTFLYYLNYITSAESGLDFYLIDILNE